MLMSICMLTAMAAAACRGPRSAPSPAALGSLDQWPPIDTTRRPLQIEFDPASPGAISGVVTDDSAGGRPLYSVMLRTRSIAVATDSFGRFRWAIGAGQVVIQTLRIGFTKRTDTLTVPSDRGLRLVIPLALSEIELEPVCGCPAGSQTLAVKVVAPPAILVAGPVTISVTLQDGTTLHDRPDGRTFIRGKYIHLFVWRPRSPGSSNDARTVTIQAHGFETWRSTMTPSGLNAIATLRPLPR